VFCAYLVNTWPALCSLPRYRKCALTANLKRTRTEQEYNKTRSPAGAFAAVSPPIYRILIYPLSKLNADRSLPSSSINKGKTQAKCAFSPGLVSVWSLVGQCFSTTCLERIGHCLYLTMAPVRTGHFPIPLLLIYQMVKKYSVLLG